jgi:hypothetical protein
MRHFIKHLKGTLKHLPKYDKKRKPNKCLEQQINQNKGGQSITNFIVRCFFERQPQMSVDGGDYHFWRRPKNINSASLQRQFSGGS